MPNSALKLSPTFGSVMSGRSWSEPSLSTAYKYGYQGSEKNDDVYGEGNSYSTHYRMLDVRLGRWFSYDPSPTIWESPFVTMGNSPICSNDPDGDKIRFAGFRSFFRYIKYSTHISRMALSSNSAIRDEGKLQKKYLKEMKDSKTKYRFTASTKMDNTKNNNAEIESSLKVNLTRKTKDNKGTIDVFTGTTGDKSTGAIAGGVTTAHQAKEGEWSFSGAGGKGTYSEDHGALSDQTDVEKQLKSGYLATIDLKSDKLDDLANVAISKATTTSKKLGYLPAESISLGTDLPATETAASRYGHSLPNNGGTYLDYYMYYGKVVSTGKGKNKVESRSHTNNDSNGGEEFFFYKEKFQSPSSGKQHNRIVGQ